MIGDSFRKGVAELEASESSSPRSGRSRRQSDLSFFTTEGYDVYRPPDEEMHKYWRAFEEMPYARKAITSFAREVVKPGWWIEADNDQQAEDLATWLRNCAIVDGQKNQDFALLMRKALIQKEVRGTSLVEHVPETDASDSLAGMKLINPETITTFTKDNSSILLEPEDPVPDDAPDKDGQAPAYVQFYDARFSDQDPVPFVEPEITKLVRDADVGDPYGTSILKPVYPRIESYREKLNDLDAAIKHKAWQVWIFQFGDEEDPWHPDDIDDFMEEQGGDQFTPGTKHGVQGDIGVETVGGEVPDITSEIHHDVDHITSALPLPMWAVTGDMAQIGKDIAAKQENLFRSQVQESRRELEYRFQEIVDKKAEELGFDPETIKLHISDPAGEENPFEDRGTVIRYESNAGADDEGEAGNQEAGEGSSDGQQEGDDEGGQSSEEVSDVDYDED